MKQKRKVKSLISSTDGRSLWLTLLLFLLGGILCFGAVSLFTSSVRVHAADNVESSIIYPGIEDKHEVLLKFGLIPKGESNPVSEMYLTGNAFFILGNTGISVDNTDMSLEDGKYINFLGGESDGVNIASDNITIIGGKKAVVLEKNDDTTILGGKENEIGIGDDEVGPVMLGGEKNKILTSQKGSAIIGGYGNQITNGGSYDFILGGNDNAINGNNVILGGARVKVNGKSDLFAFYYGDASEDFNPEEGNTFYLKLKQGLGLNETAANSGVDSNGAVSFGEVNIFTDPCETVDAGVQGVWEGCLVGCTEQSAGAGSNGKWEMIDHGTGCAKKCTDNPSRCMINPIQPKNEDPYTAYCTTNGVDTGHSHHCGGEANILPRYKNVLFETVLIDSNDECPDPTDPNKWTENRCVFKCDGGYHLTGDQTQSGGDGRTKCYKDCRLPWDGSEIKHNEKRIAYRAEDVSCSVDSDSSTYRPDTCKNYKATIICQDGTLYVADSDGYATDDTASSKGYQYAECMLHQYRCPATYNVSESDITNRNKFNDTVSNWNTTDRGVTNGTRGKYKLCIDYDTDGNGVEQLNGENCNAKYLVNSPKKHYTAHYQWVGCQNGYTVYEGKCMKQCKLDGGTRNHGQTMTAYKTKTPTCPNVCEAKTMICQDGTLYVTDSNGNATSTTASSLGYKYRTCDPQPVKCSSYKVSQATYDAHKSESRYDPCQKYTKQDKFHCNTGDKVYTLIGCVDENNFHTENVSPINGQYCVSNKKDVNCTYAGATVPNHFHYIDRDVEITWNGTWNNGSWETADNCDWKCDNNYHLEDQKCEYNSRDVNCSDFYSLIANAHWKRDGYQLWNGTWNNGHWNDPLYCEAECNDGWHMVGNKCESDCTVVTCDAYGLNSCPEHGYCSSCTPVNSSCVAGTTKYSLDSCESGWKVSGNTCVEDPSCTPNTCSAYGLNTCPEHGNCSYCTPVDASCNYGNQKAKLNSCKTGWHKVGDTCVEDDPDPSCTPTTCSDDYSYDSCPAGKECDSCTAVNSSCESTTKYKVVDDTDECEDYPLTSCPDCWSCSACPSNPSKLKKDSCKSGCTKVGNDCVPSCTPSKTCSSYGLASSPSGDCYNEYTKSNGCTNSLTCYENGCDGHKDTCYYPSNTIPSAIPGNPNYTITEYTHGVCATNNCFPAGTKVSMADGTYKNIEDVKIGDEVLSYNEETGELEPNSVLAHLVHEDVDDEMYELTINDDVLKVTAAHRFYVVGFTETDYQCVVSYEWVAAKDLEVGDRLFMKDGTYSIIQFVTHYPIHDTVYNLSVENNRTYFVEAGYLVHNAKVDIGGDDPVDDCHRLGSMNCRSEESDCKLIYDICEYNDAMYSANGTSFGCYCGRNNSTCTPTTCSSSYSYNSCPTGKGCSSCTSVASNCTETTKYKVDCTLNDCSGYGYSSCPAGKTCDTCTIVGSDCQDGATKYKVTGCIEEQCSSSYSYNSCPTGKGCSSCTATNSDCSKTTKYKVDCTLNECDDEYSYGSCPAGKTCDSCVAVNSSCESTTKYKVLPDPTDECEDYPLTSCPDCWSCSACPSNPSKLKKNGCKYECTPYNGDCVKCKADETKPAGCYNEHTGDNGCGGTYKYYTAMSTSCGNGDVWDSSNCACKHTCEYYGLTSTRTYGVCFSIYGKPDGVGGILTCYDGQAGCPAEYVCAATPEGFTDYIAMDDGNYCVRNSGTPTPGPGPDEDDTGACDGDIVNYGQTRKWTNPHGDYDCDCDFVSWGINNCCCTCSRYDNNCTHE